MTAATTREQHSRRTVNAALADLDTDLRDIRRVRVAEGPAADDLRLMLLAVLGATARLERAERFAQEVPRG